MTEFEVNKIIMPLYIDSAQVYLQLSIGALAMSIAFKEKVLGEGSTKPVTVKGDVGSKTTYDSRNRFNMVHYKMFLFA